MANIARYRPEDLFREFTRGFLSRPFEGLAESGEQQIRLDVKEDDKAYTVRAEIPGVKKEDIHVDVEGSHVSVRAEVRGERQEKEGGRTIYSECSYGMVSRSFELPGEVDEKTAKAEYKDGVLSLTLPKKAGAGTHRINIQ
jgi:HSP20 family protein